MSTSSNGIGWTTARAVAGSVAARAPVHAEPDVRRRQADAGLLRPARRRVAELQRVRRRHQRASVRPSGGRWTSARRSARPDRRRPSRRPSRCPTTRSAAGSARARSSSCSSTRRTCRCSSSARCRSSATTSTSRPAPAFVPDAPRRLELQHSRPATTLPVFQAVVDRQPRRAAAASTIPTAARLDQLLAAALGDQSRRGLRSRDRRLAQPEHLHLAHHRRADRRIAGQPQAAERVAAARLRGVRAEHDGADPRRSV